MDVSQFAETDANLNDEGEEDIFTVPDLKTELEDAKTFLQKVSPFSGDNMYDHLSDCLNRILAERPENVIDFFEEYSRKMKEQRYKPLTDHLKDLYVPTLRFEYSSRIMPFLRARPHPETEPSTADPEDEDLTDSSKRDLMQYYYYYEKAGIGLPKTELYCLEMCMNKLARSDRLLDIRFWGKIFGLYNNYFILEAEPNEEEIMRRNTALEEDLEGEEMHEDEHNPDELDAALAQVQKHQDEVGEDGESPKTKYPRHKPALPKSQYKPPPVTPRELSGEGVNKKIYYVCNNLGDSWTPLPDVTPQQIVVARQIIKNFTGNLDTEIISYPKFPGNESNYLRAQIARISAGTQISPLGYFTFGGGGGEEEEEEAAEEEEEGGGAAKTSYTVNKHYEPHTINDLADPTMSFWVHHTQYIVPQGRTKWWDPYPKAGGGEEEELEEEEEEEPEAAPGETAEPETGPPLLTPLSEDASLEAVRPWSVRSTSALLPDRAIAIVRSNLWPGAFAVTSGNFFDNIYLGYGHKHYATNFSPLPLPDIQEEYPMGPEVLEMLDPTAQMEEDWRIAHLPPEKPPKPEGEEEEEEVEEEEEDD